MVPRSWVQSGCPAQESLWGNRGRERSVAPPREARATSTAPPKALALQHCFPGTGLGEPQMGLAPPWDAHGRTLCPHTQSHNPGTCHSCSHLCAHRQAPMCLAPAGKLSCTAASRAMHPQPPSTYPDTSVHPRRPVHTPHHGHTHPHSSHIACYAHPSPCARSLHAPCIHSAMHTHSPHHAHSLHPPCTLSHATHTHPTPCMFTLCTNHTQSTPSTLIPHCTHSPYTPCTLTPHPLHTHTGLCSHPALHGCSPSQLTLSLYSTHTHPM